jgi:ABC-type transport system involved in cytochrome bd biosynthesis fused ATPase/permease subunit
VRALDPRLLHRTRSARPLLATDALLGIATALTVLVQASLLARIVARAFSGVPLSALGLELGLLVSTFAVRGALTWGMEIAGRRAAWSVLSELRLALVEKRLRAQPTAADGAESAEIAAVAVQGIEGLESYFARYLPQAVLASVVPLLVIVWVAFVDVEAALIMLLTLPLVPVFMALIGRHTEQRTRARWQALRRLSTQFLDVVRGLPTLRAFNRAHDQAAAVAD